jgi:hypothetical protein
MEKRGQLTIFIIIGIVILIILGVVFFVVYSPGSVRTPPDDFSDVQNYVDACVESSLKDAVRICGGDLCSDYNNNVSDYIKSNLPLCVDFANDFPSIEVTPRGSVSATVSVSPDRSLVSAVVYYPVTVVKGDMTKVLDRFYAELDLVERACIPVAVDANCRAMEDRTFNIQVEGLTTTWVIRRGDDLRSYGDLANCPACR